MNAQEVIDRVKRKFGDESAVQLTDTDIIRYINDAQQAIVLNNESVLETITTVDLVDGTNEYDYPTDLLILKAVRIKMSSMTSYSSVKGLNVQEFDRQIDGWDGTTFPEGRPVIYTTYRKKLYLYPTPDEDVTDGLKILYAQYPAEITMASDELSVPIQYHNAVVTFCMKEAAEMDEDYQASTIQEAKFIGDLRAANLRDQNITRDVYPTITAREEDL